MVPVLMSAKMTTALVAVVGACVIGTGIVAGTVAENRAESATTTTVVTARLPTESRQPNPEPRETGAVDPPEPPSVPVPTPGPAPAPAGPGGTTGATTGDTTPAVAATTPTISETTGPTVDTTTTGPPLCFPCVTVPTITLPDPVRIPTVHLAVAASYAVLAASTVTNTGLSVITGNLGLSPGTSVTGFLPGLVVAPGVIDTANAAAGQAQADLTSAYLDAAGRTATTIPAELGGLTLTTGVYAGPGRSPLYLTGTLTLDGGGDPGAVFIFQTDSTLITASASTVRLVNGARACNVFWQVGSSATLGTGSAFAGTIMALASITVTTGVNVQGRVLARNAAVTLDTNIVTAPTC